MATFLKFKIRTHMHTACFLFVCCQNWTDQIGIRSLLIPCFIFKFCRKWYAYSYFCIIYSDEANIIVSTIRNSKLIDKYTKLSYSDTQSLCYNNNGLLVYIYRYNANKYLLPKRYSYILCSFYYILYLYIP